ncbi:MAG TPA: maleylacetoacetate isomerase [Steroidobacteraceae bacterium]|nr:maleylacetoacetate isomerase [Gammaproteobacteria bacterium]HEV2285560.1 maleylacetoacetate isomerase [Steroidobacteraceae bacterium]
MKLHHYYRSSASYRVRIALGLKGLAYETVAIDLKPGVNAQRSAEYLALNPEGLVPVLQDGAVTLTQSLAIIEYLDETHPVPPLLPRAPAARARVRGLALVVACEMAPLNNSGVLSYLKGTLGLDEAAVNAWYARWIARGFEALEQEVASTSGDGLHMFGSEVTLADVCIVPQMYNARRFQCDLAPYPRLRGICAHLESLPAFARAVPEAFEGA